MMSNVSFTPMTIRVQQGLVSSDTLATLAKGAQLRVLPELTDVPITTKIHLADPPPNGPVPKDAAAAPPDYDAYVTVTPAQNLDPARWYVLTVNVLPPTIRPPTNGVIAGDGPRYGARFKVGSGPVVRQVEAHGDGTALVVFSEGVAVNSKTLTQFLTVKNPDLSKCTYVPPGGNLVPPTQSGVAFGCTTSIAAQKKLGLELTAGLTSPTNEPLQWFDGKATTTATLTKSNGSFDIDSFPGSCGKDCWFWRP
jgi:hypothetical protein